MNEINEEYAKALLKPGNKKDVKPPTESAKLQELTKTVEGVKKEIVILGKTTKSSNKILGKAKSVTSSSSSIGKTGLNNPKLMKNLVTGIFKLNKTISDANTKKAITETGKRLSPMKMKISGGGGKKGGGGGGGGGNNPPPIDFEDFGHGAKKSLEEIFENTFSSILTGFLGGASAFQILTQGLVEQEYEFANGMNAILYRTKGITAEAPTLQKEFRKVGDIVSTTGYDLTLFQNQFLKTSKRALKDAQNITKTGLNFGRMIGLNEQEATNIADTFADWGQYLGMDNRALTQVSRNIQQVSRYSGLTGDKLLEAVKYSEQFMEKMRSAGTLTTAAIGNIVNLSAELKKLGVDNKFADLQSMMSDSSEFFLTGNSNMQSLMANMASRGGVINELVTGTLNQSSDNLAKLAEGGKKLFKDVSGVAFEDFDKLSLEAKSKIQLRIKSAFDVGATEFRRFIEGAELAGMSFEQRMNKIDESLGKHATQEEKLAAARQKQDLYLNKAFEFSNKLLDATKNANSFDEAIDQIRKELSPEQWQTQLKDLAAVAKNAGFDEQKQAKILSGDSRSVAEAMAMSAADALKKKGGGDYSGEIKKAIRTNDFAGLRNTQSMMDEALQKLNVKETAKAEGPMAEVALQLKELNEKIRDTIGPILVSMTALIGATTALTAMIGLAIAQTYFGLKNLRDGYNLLKLGFDKFILGRSVMGAVGSKAGNAAAAAKLGSLSSTGTGAVLMEAKAAQTTGGFIAKATSKFGLLAKGIGRWLPWATVAISAWGALSQSAESADSAFKHFGVAMDELTWSQLYAYKGANLLTGILNTLTFGIFDGWLGKEGTLTKALATFNQYIPILSLISMLIDGIWGGVVGVGTMFYEIFAGIGEGLYEIWLPISDVFSAFGDLFSSIGDVISAIFYPITSFLSAINVLNTDVTKSGTVFEMIVGAFRILGKTIGWVFKTIGWVIGQVLWILKPLSDTIRLVASGLHTLADNIRWLWDTIYENLSFSGVIRFIISLPVLLLQGLASIATGILNFFASIPRAILNWFAAIPSYIGSMFDDFTGIAGGVLKLLVMPFKILGNLLKTISKHIGYVTDVITGLINLDFSKVWSALGNIFSNIGRFLYDSFMNALSAINQALAGIPRRLYDGMRTRFNSFINGVTSRIAYVANYIGDTFVGIISWIGDAVRSTFSFLDNMLGGFPSATMKYMYNLGKKGYDFFVWGFNQVSEIGKSVYGFFDGVRNKFSWLFSWMTPKENDLGTHKIKANQYAKPAPPEPITVQKTINTLPAPNAKNIEGTIVKNNMVNNASKPSTGIVVTSLKQQNSNPITPIGNTVPQPPATVTPVNSADIKTTIQKKQAENKTAENGSNIREMSTMLNVNESQLQYLMLMHGDLEKLIALLSPSGSLSGMTSPANSNISTRGVSKPINSPNYHQWQFGIYHQNASTQLITDGR